MGMKIAVDCHLVYNTAQTGPMVKVSASLWLHSRLAAVKEAEGHDNLTRFGHLNWLQLCLKFEPLAAHSKVGLA